MFFFPEVITKKYVISVDRNSVHVLRKLDRLHAVEERAVSGDGYFGVREKKIQEIIENIRPLEKSGETGKARRVSAIQAIGRNQEAGLIKCINDGYYTYPNAEISTALDKIIDNLGLKWIDHSATNVLLSERENSRHVYSSALGATPAEKYASAKKTIGNIEGLDEDRKDRALSFIAVEARADADFDTCKALEAEIDATKQNSNRWGEILKDMENVSGKPVIFDETDKSFTTPRMT